MIRSQKSQKSQKLDPKIKIFACKAYMQMNTFWTHNLSKNKAKILLIKKLNYISNLITLINNI